MKETWMYDTKPLSAADIIRKLEMSPHPEGGYYRETYRSSGSIGESSLPDNMHGYRSYSTAIYFLLKAGQPSKFHRLRSDEIWHFHLGDPIELVTVESNQQLKRQSIGPDIMQNQSLQLLIPANTWFGAHLQPGAEAKHGFSLVSCTVAPGFDFQDFELATRAQLQSVPGIEAFQTLLPAR